MLEQFTVCFRMFAQKHNTVRMVDKSSGADALSIGQGDDKFMYAAGSQVDRKPVLFFARLQLQLHPGGFGTAGILNCTFDIFVFVGGYRQCQLASLSLKSNRRKRGTAQYNAAARRRKSFNLNGNAVAFKFMALAGQIGISFSCVS